MWSWGPDGWFCCLPCLVSLHQSEDSEQWAQTGDLGGNRASLPVSSYQAKHAFLRRQHSALHLNCEQHQPLVLELCLVCRLLG